VGAAVAAKLFREERGAALTTPDFIEVYENALSAEDCAHLIEKFERSPHVPGKVGGGVIPELKDSRDIQISGKPEWRASEGALNAAMFRGLLAYLRTYRYALIAPFMLQVPDGAGGTRRLAADDFDAMDDATFGAIVRNVLRPGAINLQRYTADTGGYPYWHCELYPKDASCETLHRTLLWTIYLNDAFAEGETEFLYQQRKIQPVTGSLLIAPSAFTHTHRGNKPKGGAKYIATSWLLFQRAEVLYGSR
jgi:hypothetical protein